MKKHLITFLKFAISFAIIGYLFYTALKQDSFDDLVQSRKQWWRLGVALAVGFSAMCLSFYRWFRLVRALDLPIKLMDAFRLGFIGFLFTFLTLGVIGGDAVKAIFIARQTPNHKPEAVTTVFIDRVIGLFALFLITGIAWFFISPPAGGIDAKWKIIRTVCQISMVCTVAGVVGILLLFAMPNLNKSWLFRKLHAIPKVGGIFKRGVAAILVYRTRPIELLIAVVLSVVVHFCLTVSVFMIASGLSATHPSLIQHFVIVPIAMVANAVPLPGGLGGLEAALEFLYNNIGSATTKPGFGFIVSLAYRLITILIAAIGVMIYLSHKRQIKELMEQAETEHITDVEPGEEHDDEQKADSTPEAYQGLDQR